MKENSKVTYILATISIIILVISLFFAAYVFFSRKSNEKILSDSNKLESELEKLTQEEKQKNSEYENLLRENQEFDLDFKSKHGFSSSDDFKSLLNQEISKYKKENNVLLGEIKDNIKAYSKYYEGSYYSSEQLDNVLSKFTDLSKSDNYDNLSDDLYKDLDLADFIDYAKSEGTIKYLNSINSWSKTNNIYLFSTILYSQELSYISNNSDNSNLNLNRVSSDINSLYSLYRSMEDSGFNTGDLNSSGLLELKNKNDELNKKYFENKGVIEILENVGKNDEQFK